MRAYPQFEDLGLVDNDHTEDMRKAPAATEALRIDQPRSHHNHQGDLPTMKPHIQRLDDAVNRIDLIRADINQVIRDIPDDAPMWVIVDVVNALWNLRNASVLIDKATDSLEADTKAVR